jgi:hypothetical protein
MGMMDLNSLVDAPVLLERANDAGQVIVQGAIIPQPEVYALFLAGLVLVGFMAARRRKKTDTGLGQEVRSERLFLGPISSLQRNRISL